MNKEWIHTTHRIDPYEKRSHKGFNLLQYINDHYIGIVYSLLTLAAFVCLSAVGYIYYKKKTEIRFISAEVFTGNIESIRESIIRDRNRNLSAMSWEARRLYADKIEFIISEIAKYNPDIDDAKTIAQQIAYQSYRANYPDPFFVTAIISAESSFKLTAKSHVGARGLMQLMPATAEDVCKNHNIEWKGKSELDKPEYNIFLGVNYLKELHTYYGTNLERILIAYNWGPGHLNRALARGGVMRLPKETTNYKRKVLERHARFKKGFEEWQKKRQKKEKNVKVTKGASTKKK